MVLSPKLIFTSQTSNSMKKIIKFFLTTERFKLNHWSYSWKFATNHLWTSFTPNTPTEERFFEGKVLTSWKNSPSGVANFWSNKNFKWKWENLGNSLAIMSDLNNLQPLKVFSWKDTKKLSRGLKRNLFRWTQRREKVNLDII